MDSLNNGFNVAIGYKAGKSNSVGTSNVYVGALSGERTSGSFNTYIGTNTGGTNGSFNTFLGTNTGNGNTTGQDNVFLGLDAGVGNSTGSNNVFIGNFSGSDNQGGNGNIFIGDNSGLFLQYLDNRLIIENSSDSNSLIYGEFDNNIIEINGSIKINDFAKLKPRDT